MRTRIFGRLPIPLPIRAWARYAKTLRIRRLKMRETMLSMFAPQAVTRSRRIGMRRPAFLFLCLLLAFSVPTEAKVQSGWIWVSGSNLPNQPAVYGTLGTPAAGNVPGWRTDGVSWTDTNGNLWLFGGSGTGSTFAGLLNDLWEFNPTTNEWAWMGGSNIADQLGHYGVKGKAAATNMPGARDAASAWTDSNGNFWLFGGNGYDGVGGEGALNDLWEFNLSTKEWTFVAGGIASSQTGDNSVYGTLGVFAAQNTPGGRGGAASWADNNGHFWIFGNGAENDLWEFNPAIGEWAWMGGSNTVSNLGWVPGVYGTQGTPAPGNVPGTRTTAATWTDGNGNLWLFGGLGYADSASTFQDFLNDLWKYDPSTNEWTWMSGSNTTPGSDNSQPGVYGTLGTPAAGNVPGGRTVAANWIDKSGNLWLFGGVGDSSPPYTVLEYNDLWEYNPATNEWAWMSGSSTANQLGVYGTEGVLAPANVPGSRQSAPAWTDQNGDFWLFGGTYQPPAGLIIHFNDLWEYEPAGAAGCTPSASLTPSPLAFGNEPVGATSAQSTLTLTNSSNCPLTSIVPSLTGANPSDFAIVPASNACGSSLPASSGCFFYITFTPTAATNLTAMLSVADNAPGAPQTAQLTGTGVGSPIAALAPSPVVFPDQNINSTSAVLSVTLTNTGNAPLTGIVPTIIGVNASDFAINPASNACGASLAPGSSCFIYVTFTPTAGINYSATLSVADNAPNTPQTVQLEGTGIAIVNLAINEVIHTTDTDVATPSTLLNIAEVIHTTDSDLATPSTLLNIAEVIHTTDAPVLSQVSFAVTASGLAYSRITKTYNGTVTIKNTGTGSIQTPIQLLFNGLTPNVTLVNATGKQAGTSYITVSAPASLAPGQSVVVNVEFADPLNAAIHFTPQVQEGSI